MCVPIVVRTHTKVLQSWKFWAKTVIPGGSAMSTEDARRLLEKEVAALSREFDARSSLPWANRC